MNKYTIKDFNKQFPDDNACLEWLKNYQFPDGITCKTCGKVTNHSKLSNVPVYSCNRCGSHTHPMVGTIFENSRTPLKDWFYGMFLMSATRCGISAKQLQRELGVTYKTAWRMFKQIRSLFQSSPNVPYEDKICGTIEIDETYIGGSKRMAARFDNKTPVLGIVKREGKLIAKKVKNVRTKTVMPIIKDNILSYSMIHTDEHNTYQSLGKHHYFHKKVNHSDNQWVKGSVHTNTIEGFWSILKRGISGVYHSVSKKYLQTYIDEYVFRYNHRGDTQPMFLTVLSKV
jgi:transposase